jgi:hypothetical protein
MNGKLFILLLLVSAGCAPQTPRQPAASSTAPPLRAMGQDITIEDAHSDEAIGLQIRNQFRTTAPAETAAVTAEVNDGVVTLRGSAPTQAAAWRAQAIATAVKGVKSVINQVVITSRPSTPPTSRQPDVLPKMRSICGCKPGASRAACCAYDAAARSRPYCLQKTARVR